MVQKGGRRGRSRGRGWGWAEVEADERQTRGGSVTSEAGRAMRICERADKKVIQRFDSEVDIGDTHTVTVLYCTPRQERRL